MRLLYTVQRYGDDLVGGSEAACRMFAEQLAARGHGVEVLTSCARNYTDWADEYPPGTTVINDVTVHRLPVRTPRTDAEFGPLNAWTIHGPWPIPLFEQHRWARVMGPQLRGAADWLRTAVDRFDVAIHMTYLYATTTQLLPLTTGRLPTILQPTAHDEPALWVRVFDSIFRLPDAFLFFTPEEQATVTRRFGIDPVGLVSGIGMDVHPRVDPTDVRRQLGLGDAPYLLYVGRIDPAKGVGEAYHFFDTYKRRNPGPLKLVLVGERVMHIADHPDVVLAGFLDEARKREALAGALALVQPSYFESFSIVLCESWLQGRPALVQNGSAVLRGQAHRSGGAIPYHGFAQFEAALDLLLSEPSLADRIGESGRRYVVEQYGWDRVIDVVEATVELATRRHAERAHQPWTPAFVHAPSSIGR